MMVLVNYAPMEHIHHPVVHLSVVNVDVVVNPQRIEQIVSYAQLVNIQLSLEHVKHVKIINIPPMMERVYVMYVELV